MYAPPRLSDFVIESVRNSCRNFVQTLDRLSSWRRTIPPCPISLRPVLATLPFVDRSVASLQPTTLVKQCGPLFGITEKRQICARIQSSATSMDIPCSKEFPLALWFRSLHLPRRGCMPIFSRARWSSILKRILDTSLPGIRKVKTSFCGVVCLKISLRNKGFSSDSCLQVLQPVSNSTNTLHGNNLSEPGCT